MTNCDHFKLTINFSLTIVKSAFGGSQVLDNGGEGSAATTAATPTAPGEITLRAVRQVVTVLQGKTEKGN